MARRNLILTDAASTVRNRSSSNSQTNIFTSQGSITILGYGIKGDKGEEGDPAEAIGADKTFRHIQAIPSSIWTVTHNLGKYPAVAVTESTGTLVEGDIRFIDLNTVELTFAGAFSGSAHFN